MSLTKQLKHGGNFIEVAFTSGVLCERTHTEVDCRIRCIVLSKEQTTNEFNETGAVRRQLHRGSHK
jgi:hypothetical protein